MMFDDSVRREAYTHKRFVCGRSGVLGEIRHLDAHTHQPRPDRTDCSMHLRAGSYFHLPNGKGEGR